MSNQQPNISAIPGMEKRQQKLLACRKSVNREPRNVLLLNDLGGAAEAAGDVDRALWAYRRATHLDPSYGPAYQNLGHLLRQEGRNGAAIVALENCLKYGGRDCDRQAVESALHALRQAEKRQPAGESTSPPGTLAEDYQELAGPGTFKTAEKSAIEAPAREGNQVDAPGGGSELINPAITKPMSALGLTPAEALMLLDPDGSNAQEMLRYTTLDLVNKQVLEISSSGQIRRGPNFNDMELAEHEGIMANFFAKFNRGIDLTHYADAILARLDNRSSTFKGIYVRQVLLEKGYMRVENDRWLGFIPVRRYVLSEEGRRVVHQLKRQLKNSQSQIRRLMRRDPELAKAYLAEAGPALLLLDDYSDADFQEWRQMLEELGFGEYAGGNQADSIIHRSRELVDQILEILTGE